ncbi:MAG: helix-turn-helix transcriptional regulator [Armatimonadetes bacterium]|nr:helix-turn-helix transcriptional regulator [Armatimonadota bacterium]
MDAEQLAKLQKALAEPKRLEILTRIREMQGEGGVSCSSVLQDVGVAQSTFSHHVGELVEAGLINGCKDGKFMRLTVNEETVNEYLREISQRLLS